MDNNILKFVYGISDGFNNLYLEDPEVGYTRLDEASFYHAPRALIVFPNGRYYAATAGTCQWVSDQLTGIDCPDWAVKFAAKGVTYNEVWALLSASDFMSGKINPNREDLDNLAWSLVKKAPALRRNKKFKEISLWAKKALRELSHREFLEREKARQEFLAGCQEFLGVKFSHEDLDELRFICRGGGLPFLQNVLKKGEFKIPQSKSGFSLIYGEATRGVSYPRMEAATKLAAKKCGLTPVWVNPRREKRKLFSVQIGGDFVNKIPL